MFEIWQAPSHFYNFKLYEASVNITIILDVSKLYLSVFKKLISDELWLLEASRVEKVFVAKLLFFIKNNVIKF